MNKMWRIIMAIAVVGAVLVPSAVLANHNQQHGQTLEIEVAEDGTRFVYDEAPRLSNDFPAYGNAFVTQGYIYPAGTLDEHNGVNADGSPAFPEEVLGTWTCWGYFVGEGADTTEGAWVVTTQVFEFDSDTVGGNTIVTVGSETPAGAGVAVRSVTGGTGDYAGTTGDVDQVTLGHNAADGVNATFSFRLGRSR